MDRFHETSTLVKKQHTLTVQQETNIYFNQRYDSNYNLYD